jgi:chemotaxis protein methyltransferase CheR
MRTERHPDAAHAKIAFPDTLMEEFSTFVAQRIGLYFPRERWPDLSRAMAAITRDMDSGTGPVAGIRALMRGTQTRDEAELLARHLSVGETYFFREPAVFDALEREVLPMLIAARRKTGKRLRIWSAGCCTGEELYSMTILLDRTIPDLADWQLTLLGTDINPRFLAKATLGVYRDWSFRNAPAWIRQRYFQAAEPGSHTIAPTLRGKAAFDYLNLATDTYPGHTGEASAMDIVLCRNVLMYFEPSLARQVIDKLHRSLAADGWLVVSPAEAGCHAFPQFERMRYPDASLYRKRAAIAQATPDIAPAGRAPDRAAPSMSPSPPSSPSMPAEQDAAAMARLARRCADQGLLDEADRLCRAAIAADKCNPALRYLHATVLEEQGRFDAAMEALHRALYLDPSFVLAHFTLGSLYRRQRKDAEAERHFAHTVELLDRLAPGDVLTASDGIGARQLFNAMGRDRRTT